jgi:hypothetical protein
MAVTLNSFVSFIRCILAGSGRQSTVDVQTP